MSHPRILARLCLVIILLTCCITLILSGGRPHHTSFSSLEKSVPDGSSVRISARIAEKIRSRDGTILVLDIRTLLYRSRAYPADKFYLFEEGDTGLIIGDQIEAGGTLRYYEHARNPGNFDRHFYYGVRGVQGRLTLGYIRCKAKTRLPLREMVYRTASRAHDILSERLGEKDGSVLSSMLLGKKGLIDQDVRRLYQKNGIAHLLAISGLHLSLLGWGLYSCLKRAGVSGWPRSLMTFAALALYMMVTGFSVSVFRATVMLIIRIAAERCGRVYHGMTALAVTVVIILMRSPWYLWDASFQLSVCAVCSLYLFAGHSEQGGWRSRIREGLRVSACVFVFTMPVTLWHYFEISPFAILLNLIVIPLMPAAVVSGAAGLLLSCLPVIGGAVSIPVFLLSKIVLRIYEFVCHCSQLLPLSRLCTGRPPVLLIIIFYALIIMIWLVKNAYPTLVRDKVLFIRSIQAGLCVCFAAMLAYYPLGRLFTRDTEITMLDIGQGDCLFVDDGRGHRYLIDAGSSTVDRVAEQRIEPFLLSRGINRIDAVFVSHGDADHMNAVEEILDDPRPSLHIGILITTEKAYLDESLTRLRRKAAGVNVKSEVISCGQQIRSGDNLLQCLGPPPADTAGEKPEPGNAASMVLLLRRGDFSMLFTGDAEGAGEKALTEALSGRDHVTVLKVAHHGSRNSSGESFLQTAGAKVAWISAGRNNLYGHPHAETIERLEQTGCRIDRTDESGAVTLRTNGDKLSIRPAIR